MDNKYNLLTFRAAMAAIYTEDGVLTVAFADSTSPEPENYLILQQDVPRVQSDVSDDYYFEISDHSMSGEGGFQRAYFDGDDLILLFSEELAEKYSIQGLKLLGAKLTCDVTELHAALLDVFAKTKCQFDA
ncbi:Imm10 family immunity protein [Burkholderia vietnamiensis]|uniref:Imm10 family immunity protein n=1 Tax=Burkholderia vietnamiensis TaxID=60552 RepID=UPI0012D9BBC5|nr:Imm10 family immunity protein [Burkholderia vietnamiensis]HDR8967860.1 hypothetical protein [Burkholderia vietnamiensis]